MVGRELIMTALVSAGTVQVDQIHYRVFGKRRKGAKERKSSILCLRPCNYFDSVIATLR